MTFVINYNDIYAKGSKIQIMKVGNQALLAYYHFVGQGQKVLC